MRSLIVAALITGASTLCAQTVPATVVVADPPGHRCPIGVSAQRWAPGGMALAQDKHSLPEGRKLYLHFLPGNKSGIAAATVTLHGTDGRARVELAGEQLSRPSQTETFQLTGNEGGALLNSSVSLSRLANVRWLAVTDIRFADGTEWHESSDAVCHVSPNGFRLIGAGN